MYTKRMQLSAALKDNFHLVTFISQIVTFSRYLFLYLEKSFSYVIVTLFMLELSLIKKMLHHS